jgi:hypothetical protein
MISRLYQCAAIASDSGKEVGLFEIASSAR